MAAKINWRRTQKRAAVGKWLTEYVKGRPPQFKRKKKDVPVLSKQEVLERLAKRKTDDVG